MRPGWTLVAAASVLLLSQDAAAYCLSKQSGLTKPATWESLPVTYHVSENLTDTSILGAVDKAFSTWGSVACSKLKFSKGKTFKPCTTTPCASGAVEFKHGSAGIHIFWFTTSSDLFKNPSDSKLPYMSNTFYWWNPSGSISGASIAINAADYNWNASGGSKSSPYAFDVWNEMMPLIGGVIGLCQTSVSPAVMDGKIAFGDTSKRSLAPDDEAGLLALYSTGTSGCPAVPDGGTSPTTDKGTAISDGSVQKSDTTAPTGDGAGGGTLDNGLPAAGDGGLGKCTSSSQCDPGAICSAEGYCVVTGEGDSGCNCRLATARTGGGGGAAILALLALLVLGRALPFGRRRTR